MIRPLVVHHHDDDPLACITVRSELARSRDALRRTGPGRAWLRTEGQDYELDGSGPLLVISGRCLPRRDHAEAAASFIDAILAVPWADPDDGSIRSAMSATSRSMADVVRVLGHGIGVKIGIHLPTPACPGRVTLPGGDHEGMGRIVAHLLRDHPAHVMLSVAESTVRIAPMGSRIHMPSEPLDPISTLRLLSSLPKDMLP